MENQKAFSLTLNIIEKCSLYPSLPLNKCETAISGGGGVEEDKIAVWDWNQETFPLSFEWQLLFHKTQGNPDAMYYKARHFNKLVRLAIKSSFLI